MEILYKKLNLNIKLTNSRFNSGFDTIFSTEYSVEYITTQSLNKVSTYHLYVHNVNSNMKQLHLESY